MMTYTTEKRKNWDVWDALIVLGGVLLAREGVFLLAWFVDPTANRAAVFFAGAMVSAMVLFLLHYYFIEHRYMGTGRLNFRGEKWLWYGQIGVLTGGICFGLFSVLYGLGMNALGFPLVTLFGDLISQSDSNLERVLVGASLIGLFPIVGETLFRGFLYEALKKEMGVPGALLLSALFFGILIADPFLIPAYFLGSVALGFVYELTGSLYTPMVALGVWQSLILGWFWIG